MSSKLQSPVMLTGRSIVYDDVENDKASTNGGSELLNPIETNIQESLYEIDILRGTISYWESRPASIDPEERERLMEAFRVMHGELLGLTARMKGLLDRAGLALGA